MMKRNKDWDDYLEKEEEGEGQVEGIGHGQDQEMIDA